MGMVLLAACGPASDPVAVVTNPSPATTSDAGFAPVAGHPDPLSLLESADPVLARNKRLVFDFWRGVVNGGHVELADELLLEGYIQHSPVLRTGRTAFKEIFSVVPRLDPMPERVSPPLVALVAEGNYVVMALAEQVREPDGASTYVTTHFNLFRIEDGHLAEHWHSVQTPPGMEVPAPEDGGPQPVTGTTSTAQYAALQSADPVLAANKRLVFDAWRQIVDAGHEELSDLYLAPGYIDHSAIPVQGRDGFRERYAAQPDALVATATREPLVTSVAEGDLVVQVLKLEHPHPIRANATYTTTRFEMFRVADGRITEHWDGVTKSAACPAENGIEFVCGLTNAEDILRIGATDWLLASGMAGAVPDAAPVQGKLHLVDLRDRSWQLLFPGNAPVFEQDMTLFAGCPGPLDTGNFSAHGLALQNYPAGSTQYRLYMTSHGAREAIEMFLLDLAQGPAVKWIGCVPLPANVWANSVEILGDGGFMATNFMDPAQGFAPIAAGEANGFVLEWHPGGAVEVIAGTELSGPNGIALSDDARYLYVAAFGSDAVVRFDLQETPPGRQEVALGVVPDNLRWTPHGTLYTAGGNVDTACPDAAAASCPGWSVWEINPDTLEASRVAGVTGSTAMPSVSTALLAGAEIWVGTPRGDRVGIVHK